jgi:hypothetical protein
MTGDTNGGDKDETATQGMVNERDAPGNSTPGGVASGLQRAGVGPDDGPGSGEADVGTGDDAGGGEATDEATASRH